jgi:hypothetical protein
MNCEQVQDLLCHSESVGKLPASGALADHVAGCSECRQFVEKLAQLDQAWREMPLPPEADKARHAFVQRLPQPASPGSDARHAGRSLPSRWAVAASILLLLGMSAWLFMSPMQAQAADVVGRLVDLNLDLTQAPLAERAQLFAHSAEPLKRDLQRADLPAEDRELAEQLLANGSWLVENDDPLAQADRFNDLADRWLDRLDKAATRTDAKEAKRLARQFHRIASVGVHSNVERAEAAGKVNDEKANKRLEKIRQRDAKRLERLSWLAASGPAASHKEIKEALNAAKHAKKERKNSGDKKNGSESGNNN